MYNHHEWYSESRNQIHLNEEAEKKVKRKAKERTLDLLPFTLPYILDQFFNGPAPPYIESWMLAAEVPPFKVYQRQGHDPETSLYHYQGLSFTDVEIDQIKKRLMEWGILKTDKN